MTKCKFVSLAEVRSAHAVVDRVRRRCREAYLPNRLAWSSRSTGWAAPMRPRRRYRTRACWLLRGGIVGWKLAECRVMLPEGTCQASPAVTHEWQPPKHPGGTALRRGNPHDIVSMRQWRGSPCIYLHTIIFHLLWEELHIYAMGWGSESDSQPST
jgi:hypothetical protein